MLLIFPKKIEAASDCNYKLAEYIKKYIEERGGQAEISRKSSDSPEIEPLVCKNTVNPDIFLGLYTGEYVGGTYIIVCNAYSALAGTYNALLCKEFGDPLESETSGLDIVGELKLSNTCDITLHLPALVKDYTDDQLESLAKKLVEESCWYPIYTKTKDTSVPNMSDPYLYRFSSDTSWHEETYEFKPAPEPEIETDAVINDDPEPEVKSSGKIGYDDKDEKGHPIHYLEIDSKETGDYPVDQAIVPPETPIQKHYVWSIPLSNVPSTAKKIIFQAKGMSGGEKIYVKIGKTQATYESDIPTTYQEWTSDVATTAYTQFDLHDITLKADNLESLELGVIGEGKVRFTGIWITDSTTNYEKLPYPYRKEYSEEEIEKQEEVPKKPGITLTKAATLDDRAKDQISPPEPVPEQDTSEDPAGGASTATAEGFATAVSGVMESLTGAGKILDTQSLMKLDTNALTDKITKELDFGKKLNMSKAKEKLEGIKNAALAQAEELKKVSEDKTNALNSMMTKDALSGILPIAIPTIPTTESLSQIVASKALLENKKDALDAGITNLKKGLPSINVPDLSNLQSKIQGIQAVQTVAKNAVDTASASASTKIIELF